MAQQGYGPPTLPVGTEVSAKYRGAFCEAKVKTVVRIVKCKVVMKDCQTSIIVTDEEVKGPLKLGGVVEVKHPDTEQTVEATINKLIDQSTYTVVFDDGDERTLRRSQLCLKGDKHFIESETLDNLPLSHPEHFGTPVLQSKKAKRKTGDESDAEEEEEEESEEESPRRAMYRGRHQELVGKLMLVDLPQRKGSAIPALVVLPDATSISEVKSRDQILVRSFKDSKFMTVTRKDLKEFSRSVAIKNEDKTMRTAFEKALLYFDTKELPVGWKKEDMLGSDLDEEDEGEEDNEYASEDEPFEEKDRFVAQLYKFMDDRGTPINKGPCIGNKDLNLYKLFKIVENIGGYNKVTKEMKWPVVYSKMGLPSLHQNPAHQIKTAYKKYLDAYETFYRKLGSTMGTLSRPGRARHNSGRSILNFRGRDKSPRSPKPTEKMKAKEEAEASKSKPEPQEKEKADDAPDASNTSSKEDNEPSTRRTQRRDRLQAVKEKEEVKEKKEEPPKTKEKKEEPPKTKEKKEETPKGKKEDVTAGKSKEEVTPATKVKREEAGKGKKEEANVKKEERKSTRKISRVEEEKEEKDEKKVIRGQKKEVKEEVPEPEESPKKRLTRRKILQLEPAKKEAEVKEEPVEEKKEPVKKQVAKEPKVIERKEKEIPRTLERRDSKAAERKENVPKVTEKKENKVVAEKKTKAVEERKSVRRERKPKDSEKEEDASDGDEEESSDQDTVKLESSAAKSDCPVGSKIKVKYGKGKNQKIYAAKIVDIGKEGTHKTYLVHYAGWNMRYDEWIRADRVVSVLDRPEVEKIDKPRTPAVKAQTTIATSIKRLAHRSPLIGQKVVTKGFRTPKVIASKTRSTRSSSTELKAPPTKPDKRTTRRRSTVAESSESKSGGNLSAHQGTGVEETSKPEVLDVGVKDKEEEEETISIDVEEEDEEEGITEKTDLDTSIDEEEESGVKEEEEEKDEMTSQQTVSNDAAKPEEALKSDIKEEVASDNAQKGGLREVQDSIKKVEEMTSSESKNVEKKDATVTDKKGAEVALESTETSVKSERASVRVAELKSEVDEIMSIDFGYRKEDEEKKVESSESAAPVDESQSESQVDSMKEEAVSSQNPDEETSIKEEISVSAVSESGVSTVPETEDESTSLDQNIPQLKKIDLELERREWESERAKSRARRKESGKDGKKVKLSEGSSFNSSSSGEIPTLEPIFITATTTNSKSSPSPYDFDETEAESQWQPEITKKWEPVPPEQISTSTENNATSEDNQEKEKKKVKKKAKKKPISPQFVPEAKADESNASIEDNAQTTPENKPADTEKKQGVKKKGRKRKELNPELKKEVMEQYEMTVNSVVESVKHSLKDSEQPGGDAKPILKKRRLKRVSESDKKDTGRPVKPERRRGVRDSLDTVEALNVEGSKEKSSLQSSSTGGLESLQASNYTADNVSGNAHVVASNFSAVDSVLDDSVKHPSISDSQGFVPQIQERDTCRVPFENTPPTTPEYDDGEDGTAAIQPPQDSSPRSDDLTIKTDAHKDSSSSSSSISLPAASAVARVKSASESPSDNDMASTASTDNLETGAAAPQSADSSGTEQESAVSKKRKPVEDTSASAPVPKKKKRVHGTRSRTARKSPKYVSSESTIFSKVLDSSGSSGGTPNHSPDSPSARLVDITKSPRPSKYNFNADLGEHLEGEARCNFLIGKLKEIKTIYMSLKAEVASIDRRRKRIRRKERESSQASPNDRDGAR